MAEPHGLTRDIPFIDLIVPPLPILFCQPRGVPNGSERYSFLRLT